MGLLGDGWDDPKSMATMQLAAGLLGGGNFGQALGRGLSGYQQTMASAQDAQRQKMLDQMAQEQFQWKRDDRAKDANSERVMQETIDKMDPRYIGMNGPRVGTQLRQIDPFTQNLFNLAKADPGKYGATFVAAMKPQEAKYEKVGNTLVKVGGDDKVTELYSGDANDPNKPFLRVNGQIVANPAYQAYEINKARAGATNVKIDNKMGESLAGQIGPMVKETWTAANGAIQTADAANRVLQGVNGNKLYAGPGSNIRMSAAQIGDTLGMTGKDTAEKIANTRQTITGLAQMTLQGRKQMTGQGAITESESKLAERAMSGDISMTPAEIKQLASAAHRAAKFTYSQHQSQLSNMRQDPNMVNLSKFYTTAPFPDMPSIMANPTQATQGGARFLGFE